MLDSHIHKTPLTDIALIDTAYWESAEWGAWVIVHVERCESVSANKILEAIRGAVEQGGPICLAIQETISDELNNCVQSMDSQKEGCTKTNSRADACVSVMACRFDSFHYELCLSGSACAFLTDQLGGTTSLTPEDSEGVGPNTVSRVLGDIHEGESLVLSAHSLSTDIMTGVAGSCSSAEALVEHVVRQVRSRGALIEGPVLALRYQEDDDGIQRSDFYHRSPIDRSRYRSNSTARPLFLLLVLLALCAILLIL